MGQREIERKIGADRKTIRRYGRIHDLVAHEGNDLQNPPPRPPAPKHAVSACEPHREWIEDQVGPGRNGIATGLRTPEGRQLSTGCRSQVLKDSCCILEDPAITVLTPLCSKFFGPFRCVRYVKLSVCAFTRV